jgi:1-acyl-sn-glycerol-3-phosphate acyltransferase
MNRFFRFVYTIAKPILLLFHPIAVEGLEALPRGGVLLCPNHCSNWDPILLVLSLPKDYRLHIMAKDSLFHIPVLNWIVGKLGAFPVARGSADIQAVKTSIQAIKSGDNLLIFPEGTRVNGEGEVRAKGGAAVVGVRTGAILVPVYISPEKRMFHKTRIVFGKPYTPVYTGRHGTAEEMQKIADDLLAQAYAMGREQA